MLDFAAIGEPAGVRFEGLTGAWSYSEGVLTLSDLEGEGAIKILKRLGPVSGSTPSGSPPPR